MTTATLLVSCAVPRRDTKAGPRPCCLAWSKESARRMPRRCGHSQRRSQRHKTAAAASSAVVARSYERSLVRKKRRNNCSCEAFQACGPKIAQWTHSASFHPRMRAGDNRTVPVAPAQVVRNVCSGFNARCPVETTQSSERQSMQLQDDVAVRHRTPTLMQEDMAELLIHSR